MVRDLVLVWRFTRQVWLKWSRELVVPVGIVEMLSGCLERLGKEEVRWGYCRKGRGRSGINNPEQAEGIKKQG